MNIRVSQASVQPTAGAGQALPGLWPWITSLWLVCGCVLLGGCAAAPLRAERTAQEREAVAKDLDNLEARIQEFVDYFQAALDRAAADVERRATNRDQRRAAASWRIAMARQSEAAARRQDPRDALLDTWVFCQNMYDQFAAGRGTPLSGEAQQIVADMTRQALGEIEQVARQHIAPGAFAAVKARVIAYSKAHPIQGPVDQAQAGRASDSPEMKAVHDIVGLPLAPLAAMRGVARAPESVRDVSRSVDRFTEAVEDLPANARWQAQLLAMNLEDLPTVANASTSLQTLANSSNRFAQTLEGMPSDMRRQAEGLVDHLEAAQPQIRDTLVEARKTAEMVGATTGQVQDAAVELQRTLADVQTASEALDKAASSVTVTAKQIQKFIPGSMKDETGQIIGEKSAATAPISPSGTQGSPDTRRSPPAGTQATSAEGGAVPAFEAPQPVPSPSPDHSFSFQAVTQSAEALTNTCDRLRDLLAEITRFVDRGYPGRATGAVEQQVRSTVDLTSMRLEGVVDRITGRAAALMVLLFGLALLYRYLTVRLTRHRPSP